LLQYLKDADVWAIIAAAERNNASHPPSERGITFEMLDEPDQPDPEGEAFEELIRSLSQEARCELLAVILLGNVAAPGDFAECLAHAKRNTDKGDVDYIVGKLPLLPAYLRAGMGLVSAQAKSKS
jgi:hypothetical protein